MLLSLPNVSVIKSLICGIFLLTFDARIAFDRDISPSITIERSFSVGHMSIIVRFVEIANS